MLVIRMEVCVQQWTEFQSMQQCSPVHTGHIWLFVTPAGVEYVDKGLCIMLWKTLLCYLNVFNICDHADAINCGVRSAEILFPLILIL